MESKRGHNNLQIPLEAASGKNKKTVTVNYVTGNTGVKIFQARNKVDQETTLKNILDQSRLRLLADFDPRTFLKTEVSDKCEKMMQIRGFVTVISPQGQGKTITSLYLLKTLLEKESRQPFILTDPYQWDLIPVHQHTEQKEKYAVLMDDAFGRLHHNPDLMKGFEQRLPMIMPLIESGIVSLIITSRTNIFFMYTYNHTSSVVEMTVSLYDMMYTAAKRGETEVIKRFFEGVLHRRIITALNRSLLYCAVEYGHIGLVKYLDGKVRQPERDVSKGADTHFETTEQEYMEMIKYLFGRNLEFDEKLAGIVRLLVGKEEEDGNDKNENKNIPNRKHVNMKTLHATMCKCLFGEHTHLETGHLEMVDFFADRGAHHYPLLDQLLLIASNEGHREITRYLVGKGADLEVRGRLKNSWDIWGYTPLQIATEKGETEMVKCLIEIGANMEAGDMLWYTPLQLATGKGHTETARILIEKGAKLNARNMWGYSSLHIAIDKGHEEIAVILIGKGADLNIKTRSGYSPLQLATEKGYTKIATMLIERGADLNVKSWAVHSPLIIATKEGHTEIAKCLAEKGANLNVTDWSKNTPLHIAIKNGCTGIVKCLLANGANRDMTDGNQRSPLNIAAQQGHIGLVKHLIDIGAVLKTTMTVKDKDGNLKEIDTDNDLQTKQLYLAALRGHIEQVRSLGGKGMKQHEQCVLS